jgi:hypothetical protein
VKGRQCPADLWIADGGEPSSGVLGSRLGPRPDDARNHDIGKPGHDRGRSDALVPDF